MGSRLRALREARTWSRDTLARKAGCGEATISRIELYGTTPSLPILLALAAALEVSVTDLIETDELGPSVDEAAS